jgi:7,8-dihydropterin-6-yl-methyl-4-(beta-D-ribofuranosyl)aminobenzene 5'-phosphate synthase
MIRDAQEQDPATPGGLIVDLHPERPDYRGFQFPGQMPVSLQADPTFAEIEAAGAKIEKSSKPHTVLDNMFLVSGEIPRVTPYETGLKAGVRFFDSTKKWEKDEEMADERLLMCNVKGTDASKSHW